MNLLSALIRLLSSLLGQGSASAASAGYAKPKSSIRQAQTTLRTPSKDVEAVMGSLPSLKELALQYENELADRTFEYTFCEKGKKPFTARVEFERSGFCHLFSIASASGDSSNGELAGMKGWRKIQSGAVSFELLYKACPEQFAYYAPEWGMLDALIDTAKHPNAVRFVKEKISNSRLEADVLLYRIVGDQTVHLALSQGKDGWFVRSYFVRDNARDREYPTRYIAGMPELDVKCSVKH